MSKASEWLRGQEVPAIAFDRAAISARGRLSNYTLRAEVTPRCALGFSFRDDLGIIEQAVLTPEQALALARWILDTFSEPRP